MAITLFSYEEMDKTFAYAKKHYGDDEEIASLLEDVRNLNSSFKVFSDEAKSKEEANSIKLEKQTQLSMICTKIGQRIGEIVAEGHCIWHALNK